MVSTIAGAPGEADSTDGVYTNATFNGPAGIALDSANNIYVADTGNHTIRKINPSGVVSTLAGFPPPASPGSRDGPVSRASFGEPAGIALDSAGNIYVVDGGYDTIRKLTPDGIVSTIAGHGAQRPPFEPVEIDGLGTNLWFNDPVSVAIDAAGNLYVADSLNNLIRMITAGGVVTTLAGPLPGGVIPGSAINTNGGYVDGAGFQARFNTPSGVAVDSSGVFYVADTGNSMIRKAFLAGSAAPPSFLVQPESQTADYGSDPSLSAVASGSTPLSYQWKFSGTNIALATGPTLTLTNVQGSQAGSYTLFVTNLAGTNTSSTAFLTVTGGPPQRIIFQPALVAGVFTLSIATQAGGVYTLEYKNSLTSPFWMIAQKVAGTGDLVTLPDTKPASATRCYRVIIQ